MLCLSFILMTLVASFLTLVGCYPKQPEIVVHTTVKTTHTIVTPAPAPQEVVSIPAGSSNCFTVQPGWYNNIWVHEHRICQYKHAEENKRVWVSSYWECSNYTMDGTCNNWDWVKGHWADTIVSY
jgi:hypothetical protein